MRYAIMQSFRMHHTDTEYGIPAPDRFALLPKVRQIGFDGVELGLDLDYAQDPLWTDEGGFRLALRQAAAQAGVAICSLCLHLFNYQEHSPASVERTHRATGRRILEHAIAICHEIGAGVILIPFFGTATLRTESQIQHLVEEMRGCAATAASLGVCLALETSLDAPTNLAILDRIGSEAVRIYFDTGNTAGFGFDVIREIHDLGSAIAQVHIKNHPAAPVLSQGTLDFAPVIAALQQVGFDGYLVLELPSADEHTTRENLRSLKRMVA